MKDERRLRYRVYDSETGTYWHTRAGKSVWTQPVLAITAYNHDRTPDKAIRPQAMYSKQRRFIIHRFTLRLIGGKDVQARQLRRA